MTRDLDADDPAEALEWTQVARGSWLSRLARRFLLAAIGPAAAAVALAILLAKVGVDLGWLLMAMFYATPFIVVAVVSFVVHAWRQNTGLTYGPQESQADLATEPGQVGQDSADQTARDMAGHRAKHGPTTVTVTVLPTAPTAALPRAAGQTAPIHYDAEEETR